jgi:hypothetical protein
MWRQYLVLLFRYRLCGPSSPHALPFRAFSELCQKSWLEARVLEQTVTRKKKVLEGAQEEIDIININNISRGQVGDSRAGGAGGRNPRPTGDPGHSREQREFPTFSGPRCRNQGEESEPGAGHSPYLAGVLALGAAWISTWGMDKIHAIGLQWTPANHLREARADMEGEEHLLFPPPSPWLSITHHISIHAYDPVNHPTPP